MAAASMTLMIVTSGCLSIKAYVDPQLPKVGYADLLARPDPRPVSLLVEFRRNGEPATLGATTAREAVPTVVEKSKLFSSLLDKPRDDVDRIRGMPPARAR